MARLGVALAALVFAGLATVTLEPALGRAQEDDETPATGASQSGRLNLDKNKEADAPEGTYQGVSPGGSRLPPHPPHLPVKRGPQRLTWPGFQVKDGVPTVFLELTGPPDYQLSQGPGELVVTLKNTVVHLRNNRRPLNVTAFGTPVTAIETKPVGHSVRVTIRTIDRLAPMHQEHVEQGAGGFPILVILLPSRGD